MTQLSKFINLLIEYGEKVEGHLHKKYRPFISSIINLKELAKSVNSKKVCLTNEMIVFKIGIQSKSTKCIETSLYYLHKLFTLNFIDLSQPNYCENYVIADGKVQHKPVQSYQKQMRHEFTRLLQPLIHFKNNEINNLLLKIYEYLIGQPIIVSILQICSLNASENSYNILYSYFSYRFYLFEECYLYKERQIESFSKIIKNQKINIQIKSAMDRQEHFTNLVQKYVEEVAVKVAGEGGKYGYCIICSQPADHYCKITKASLCGLDCKKKHLQIAQKQYKDYYHSILIGKSLIQGFELILKYLSEYNSPLVLSVLAQILQKPQLFMLVCDNFKQIIKKYIPQIINKVYQSRNQQIFETAYFLMASITKWWPTQCLSALDYFLRQSILNIISDKKPTFRILMLAFKSLARIFEFGKTVVEIYVNFDCETNQNNFIEKIMFQLSKMAQDKFAGSNFYHKQQKIAIKNSCMTIFQVMSKGLNEYRKQYQNQVNIEPIKQLKIRKTNIEKFILKFNEHWQEGLKCLFNLNLVGLQSNNEIIKIVTSLEGLKKDMIDMMLFDKKSQHLLAIFMEKLAHQPTELVTKLLQLYQYIPLSSTATIGMKKFISYFQDKYQVKNFAQVIQKITKIFIKVQNFQQFKTQIAPYCQNQQLYESQYLLVLNIRKPQTCRPQKHFYRICQSKSYLDVISSQISLLQIPLSYMLDASYDIQKIITLIKDLIPICIHSNWLSLLIKYSSIQQFNTHAFTETNLRTMKGVIEITMEQTQYIIDWLTIFNFICNLHYLLTNTPNNPKKVYLENKAVLGNQISVNLLEKCLVGGSTAPHLDFKRYILAILTISKQQLQVQRIFLLQKFFQILDSNVNNYLRYFDDIYEELMKFCLDLKPTTNSETMIYICDMLKQFLLRLLKEQIKDQISLSFFELLEIMFKKGREGNQKDVTQFSMTCMSMVIVHHYNFKERTWNKILEIFLQNGKEYKYQTGLIIKKIITEKVRHLNNNMQIIINLIKICLTQISQNEIKVSNQAIRSIKFLIDEDINPLIEEEVDIEEKLKRNKHIIKYTIDEMIQYISYDCHQTVIEIVFLLFDAKTSDRKSSILCLSEVNEFIQKIFLKLQALPLQIIERGQKIMNQSLNWSVKKKSKNIGIIKILQNSIINKHTSLANNAIKCIKTFIQMTNPRQEQDWRQLQETLLHIVNNSQNHIPNSETFPSVQVQKIINNQYTFEQRVEVNIKQFIHKCKMQTMAVELLPNDAKCLDELVSVYHKIISFNDNLLLRIALWKSGLGQPTQPPHLLNLQEIFSNRIMAIYMTIHNQSTLRFITDIYQRYLNYNLEQEKIQQSIERINAQTNDTHFELFTFYQSYLQIRKAPLFKIMAFALPKLNKLCKNREERKQIMLTITSVLPYIQKRQPYIKVIREITLAKAQ